MVTLVLEFNAWAYEYFDLARLKGQSKENTRVDRARRRSTRLHLLDPPGALRARADLRLDASVRGLTMRSAA